MNRVERRGKAPNPAEIVQLVDKGMRVAARRARDEGMRVVRAGAPGSFAGQGMGGSVRKTPNGYLIIIQPRNKDRRYIARLVAGGTGIYGPKRRPIKPRKAKAFRFNGREYETVRGQKPNPFIDRARPVMTTVITLSLNASGHAVAELIRRR